VNKSICDFSIIIPCRNEIGFIERMLRSVLQQDIFASFSGEIIVIDGNSNDGTTNLLKKLESEIQCLNVMSNPLGYVSSSLNIGVSKACGKYIVRLDAHAIYPSNYISTLINYMENNPDVENCGVPFDTVPSDNTRVAISIAHTLSHKFGVGSALYRLERESPICTDTVPYGCFRREIFAKLGGFDLDLIRNQDDEFNGRIIKSGAKVVLLPSPKLTYFARGSFGKHWLTYYQYGLFKPLTVAKLRRPATFRQLIPPFFVLGNLILLILSLFGFKLAQVTYLFIIITYCLLSIVATNDLKKRKYFVLGHMSVLSCWPYVLTAMFIMHFSYGCGYLVGLTKLLLGFPIVSVKNSR